MRAVALMLWMVWACANLWWAIGIVGWPREAAALWVAFWFALFENAADLRRRRRRRRPGGDSSGE